MERIYLIWLHNKKEKRNSLIKAFHSPEMALAEKKKQEASLKEVGRSLDYDVLLESFEVY